MDRGAWWARVHGGTKSQTQLRAQLCFVVKDLPANAGDMSSIPGSGRSPGEGNGNPFQYSCLRNPMDRGAWWATVHGVTRSQTRLSSYQFCLFVVSL